MDSIEERRSTYMHSGRDTLNPIQSINLKNIKGRVVGVAIRLLPQLLFHFHFKLLEEILSMMKTDRHTPKGREVVQGQVIGSEFTLKQILLADTEIKIFKPGHSSS
jgi:hypothetical protein